LDKFSKGSGEKSKSAQDEHEAAVILNNKAHRNSDSSSHSNNSDAQYNYQCNHCDVAELDTQSDFQESNVDSHIISPATANQINNGIAETALVKRLTPPQSTPLPCEISILSPSTALGRHTLASTVQYSPANNLCPSQLKCELPEGAINILSIAVDFCTSNAASNFSQDLFCMLSISHLDNPHTIHFTSYGCNFTITFSIPNAYSDSPVNQLSLCQPLHDAFYPLDILCKIRPFITEHEVFIGWHFSSHHFPSWCVYGALREWSVHTPQLPSAVEAGSPQALRTSYPEEFLHQGPNYIGKLLSHISDVHSSSMPPVQMCTKPTGRVGGELVVPKDWQQDAMVASYEPHCESLPSVVTTADSEVCVYIIVRH
jgi:hypothetical protein